MQKKKNDWKKREGVVYSTNEDFKYEAFGSQLQSALTPPSQTKRRLHVFFEKKGRAGKTVTIIDGFDGEAEKLQDLAKQLKQTCGVGGAAKDGQVILQGDVVQKAKGFLTNQGYGIK